MGAEDLARRDFVSQETSGIAEARRLVRSAVSTTGGENDFRRLGVTQRQDGHSRSTVLQDIIGPGEQDRKRGK